MYAMFSGHKNNMALTNINGLENWNTEKVTDMQDMFSGCGFYNSEFTSLDVSSFDTSNVTSMTGMFEACVNLNSIIFGNNFNTSNVTTMESMFYSCSKLASLDLSVFNTENVTTMENMFFACGNLNQILVGPNWTSYEGKNTTNMFKNCKVQSVTYQN